MKLRKQNLGKVAITVEKDYWQNTTAYDRLTIVEVDKVGCFISRKPVPTGVNYTDRNYWIKLSNSYNSGSDVPTEGKEYLKYSSDSETIQALLEGTTGSSFYNQCCELIYNAVVNNLLIIIDDGICLTQANLNTPSFNLTCKTTTDSFIIGAYKDNNNVWHKVPGTSKGTNKLITNASLNSILQTKLSEYLPADEINNLFDATNLKINRYNNTVVSLQQDYTERMSSTPKYHKANWLKDEVNEDGDVTTDSVSSGSSPRSRWSSLWWAIKDSNASTSVSKIILYFGVPAIYTYTDNLNNVDNATTIIIKFYDGAAVTEFTITKNTDGGGNLYLHVVKEEYSKTNDGKDVYVIPWDINFFHTQPSANDDNRFYYGTWQPSYDSQSRVNGVAWETLIPEETFRNFVNVLRNLHNPKTIYATVGNSLGVATWYNAWEPLSEDSTYRYWELNGSDRQVFYTMRAVLFIQTAAGRYFYDFIYRPAIWGRPDLTELSKKGTVYIRVVSYLSQLATERPQTENDHLSLESFGNLWNEEDIVYPPEYSNYEDGDISDLEGDADINQDEIITRT